MQTFTLMLVVESWMGTKEVVKVSFVTDLNKTSNLEQVIHQGRSVTLGHSMAEKFVNQIQIGIYINNKSLLPGSTRDR